MSGRKSPLLDVVAEEIGNHTAQHLARGHAATVGGGFERECLPARQQEWKFDDFVVGTNLFPNRWGIHHDGCRSGNRGHCLGTSIGRRFRTEVDAVFNPVRLSYERFGLTPVDSFIAIRMPNPGNSGRIHKTLESVGIDPSLEVGYG